MNYYRDDDLIPELDNAQDKPFSTTEKVVSKPTLKQQVENFHKANISWLREQEEKIWPFNPKPFSYRVFPDNSKDKE